MITAVIVEDERLARIGMHQLLDKHVEQIILRGEADTAHAAIKLIEEQKPDLVFLDIHLPDMNGIKMLEMLSYQPKIIFTTAYEKYAMEAFDKMSVDYLVKPISQERFDRSITKLLEFHRSDAANPSSDLKALLDLIESQKQKNQISSIPVKKRNKIILVDLEDVAFFKSEDKLVTIKLVDGGYHVIDKTLSELEFKLPERFLRVHRSYIINISEILEIEKYFKGTLVMTIGDKEETKIKTGEKYSKKVKEVLGIV